MQSPKKKNVAEYPQNLFRYATPLKTWFNCPQTRYSLLGDPVLPEVGILNETSSQTKILTSFYAERSVLSTKT